MYPHICVQKNNHVNEIRHCRLELQAVDLQWIYCHIKQGAASNKKLTGQYVPTTNLSHLYHHRAGVFNVFQAKDPLAERKTKQGLRINWAGWMKMNGCESLYCMAAMATLSILSSPSMCKLNVWFFSQIGQFIFANKILGQCIFSDMFKPLKKRNLHFFYYFVLT